MQKLRYFSNRELVNVTHAGEGVEVTPETVQSFYSPKLLAFIDALRHRAGLPILLTSGYRCNDYNEKVGGTPGSSHTKGLAFDFACSDSSHRFLYLRAALSVGFTRIGIGKTYIHVDIDDTKEPGVVWLY